MRVKKEFKKIKIFLLFLFVFFTFSFSVSRVSAQKVNLSQSILPVRLVYFNKKGEIKNIKDITSKDDALYIIKFYNYKNELISEKDMTFIKKQKYFQGIKNKMETKEANLIINFVEKKGKIEEVHTYV